MDVNHPLIAKAIQEMGMGQSGMQMLESSFRYAQNAHKTRKPEPTKSAMLNDPRLAKHPDLVKMFEEQDARRRKVLDEGFTKLHRANLAQFFTMSGVSKDTAFKIVDEFILNSNQ